MSTRNPQNTAALRPLGLPRPVEVREDAEGMPLAVARRRGAGHNRSWQRVEQIDDAWRVAEEWWRSDPQERTYVRVLLDGGRPLTLFQDGRTRRWFEQSYAPGTGPSGDAHSNPSTRR